MTAKAKGQVGMDETVLEDPELEALLETRAKRAASKLALTADYKKADKAAKEALAKVTIPEEGAIRVGRFRITKSTTAANHVEFDTEAGSRVRIATEGATEE